MLAERVFVTGWRSTRAVRSSVVLDDGSDFFSTQTWSFVEVGVGAVIVDFHVAGEFRGD